MVLRLHFGLNMGYGWDYKGGSVWLEGAHIICGISHVAHTIWVAETFLLLQKSMLWV